MNGDGKYVRLAGLSRRRDDPAAYMRAWRSVPENEAKRKAYAREYYHRRKTDPAYKKMKLDSGKASRRKRKYGITKREYDVRVKEQKGLCAICRKPETNLRVDHCHVSGDIRGLLCPTCNTGLGLFYDAPESLRAGAKYLETFNSRKKSHLPR